MIASVYIGTSSGEQLVRVEAYDLDPYLTLTVRGHTVALTRDEARKVSDALRAVGLTAEDRGDCLPAWLIRPVFGSTPTPRQCSA